MRRKVRRQKGDMKEVGAEGQRVEREKEKGREGR